MIWICAVVGALVTGGLASVVLDDELALLGAVLGFAIGLLVGLTIRVSQLGWAVRRMGQRLQFLESAAGAGAAAPAPARAAEGEDADQGRESAGGDHAPPPEATGSRGPEAGPAGETPPADSPPSPPPAPVPPAIALPPSAPPSTRVFPESPRRPVAPGGVERARGQVVAFFTGDNAVVRVGLLVLFLGVAFLYRYGMEQDWIGVEWNYISVSAAAFAALAWAWRRRATMRDFSILLQGGAMGLLYITVFSAYKLDELIPQAGAFALLAVLVALATALALLQNARGLAVAGMVGGFLAPILVSTGLGQHVVLFSFYALLNAGIMAIAWFRAWRELTMVGFAFTLGVGSTWAGTAYRPEHFATTQPFLVLFFLMFSLMGVLSALRRPPRLRGYIDATLVFGTPLSAFALQWALVRRWEMAAAYSALVVAGYYLALARWAWRRASEQAALRPLAEAFLALAVAFVVLAVPLALEGLWISVAWVLQGAALVWVGVRQERRLAAACGVALQVAAGIWYLARLTVVPMVELGDPAVAWRILGEVRALVMPVINTYWMSGALIAGAGLVSGWLLSRRQDRWEWALPIQWVLVLWGLAWWLGTQAWEVHDHVTAPYRPAVLLAVTAASLALFRWLGRRAAWRPLELSFLLLLPAMGLALPAQASAGLEHPFSRLGWVAWPAAVALWYHGLRAGEGRWPAPRWLHRPGLWLVLAVSCLELAWQVNHWVGGAALWGRLVWAVLPAAVVWELGVARRWQGWPVAAHVEDYRRGGLAPVAAWLWLWVLYTGLAWDGQAAPLPHLPLLNPLELVQAGVLAALAAWLLRHREWMAGAVPARLVAAAWAGTVFLWFNGVLARAAHHLMGVPFQFEALMASFRFQALASVLWGIAALGLMVAGARRGSRQLWTVGLGLYGLTVAKLFLMDLAGRGTLERIVSFLVVGVLLVATGFFARRPAADGEGRA